MICKQCGADVDAGASGCQYCGCQVATPGQAIKQFIQALPSQVQQPQHATAAAGAAEQVVPGFSELKPYYQWEFRRIFESQETYKGKWNWAAFFWGPLWALSKGLWLSGVIALVICFFSSGVLTIPVAIIYGLRGNYQYYTLLKKGTLVFV